MSRFRAGLLALLGILVLAGCGQPLPQPERALPVPAAAPGRAEGRLLYVRGGNIWAWSNGQELQLTTEGNYSQPRWSPSGNNMLYVRRGESFADLYVADSAGKTPRAITANQSKAYPPETEAYVNNSFQLTGPSWSRSPEGGDRIVYSTDRESAVLGLWVLNGLTGKPQPIFGAQALGATSEGAALSPDGGRVAFTCDMTDDNSVRSTQIYLIDLNTGLYHPLGQQLTNVYDPVWSPDGQWIAYAARQGDETQLWVIRADGSGRQRIVGDGRNRGATWSPDGTQIAFVRQQSAGFGLFFVDLEATQTGFNASKPQRIGDFSDADPTSGTSWAR